MIAIFETGSKQYKVSEGDVIYTEKLNEIEGKTIVFDKVLMIDNSFGSPYLNGAKIECVVLKQGKQPKLTIIKHISQKHHTKKQGHRQPYTKLEVKKIILK